MYKQVLESINGIEIYPLFSFTVFFVFFIAVGIWVYRSDRDHLNLLSRIPLQDEENANDNQNELL